MTTRINLQHFVGCEIGFWSHPKTQLFCKRIKAPLGGAYVLRLREFVFNHGTAEGRISASADEIALAIGWNGKPDRLIEAMKESGFLRRDRRGFLLPGWQDSVTGHYQSSRATNARRMAAKREQERRLRELDGRLEGGGKGGAGEGEESNGARTVHAHDPHGSGTVDPNKQIRENGAPPVPPKGGCDACWQNFWTRYGNRDNPEKNRLRYLALTHDVHERIDGHLDQYLKTNTPRFQKRMSLYLRNELWWALKLPEETAASKRSKVPEISAEERAEIERRKREHEEREERHRQQMIRLGDIKRRLRSEGVAKGEIEERAWRELEAELKRDQLEVLNGGES